LCTVITATTPTATTPDGVRNAARAGVHRASGWPDGLRPRLRPEHRGNVGHGWDAPGRARRECRGQTAHPGPRGTAGTGVEQAHNPEVAGSNPAPATIATPQVRALLRPRGGALSRARIEMIRAVCGLAASIPASNAVSSRITQRTRLPATHIAETVRGVGFSGQLSVVAADSWPPSSLSWPPSCYRPCGRRPRRCTEHPDVDARAGTHARQVPAATRWVDGISLSTASITSPLYVGRARRIRTH
jgi:hypothetical protein